MELNFDLKLRKKARLIQLAIYGLKYLAKKDRSSTLTFLQKEGYDIMSVLDDEASFAVEKLSYLTKNNVECFIEGKNIMLVK
ncbi:MAG TPA: hypothetical protein PLP33_14695 [Leptospiraceae bacterium]|nr:hypothetical protein [Leptospiraceae bacterium]